MQGHFANLIQQKCPALRRFYLSRLRRVRARVGTPGMAKQLAFQQCLRHRRAVDRDERAGPPRAPVVNQSRQNLFSRPAFGFNQNIRFARRRLPSVFDGLQ